LASADLSTTVSTLANATTGIGLSLIIFDYSEGLLITSSFFTYFTIETGAATVDFSATLGGTILFVSTLVYAPFLRYFCFSISILIFFSSAGLTVALLLARSSSLTTFHWAGLPL
jgi:hypothetical protein